MRPVNNILKYNSPYMLWAVIILCLCLMPGKDLPSVSLWQFDKLVHAGVFALLAMLMYWGLVNQPHVAFTNTHLPWKVVVICAVYGILLEVMQGTLTADRMFDPYDAIANTIGAACGGLISVKVWGKPRKLS